MQTKDVARILKVDPSTVRRWARDYSDYLSATAQPAERDGYYRRDYTQDDLKVFLTVQRESQQGTLLDDIATILANGDHLVETLPPDLPMPEEDRVEMMPVSTAVERVKSLQTRITTLEIDLTEARALADARADKVAELERELGDTRVEVAKLEGKADLAKAEARIEMAKLEDKANLAKAETRIEMQMNLTDVRTETALLKGRLEVLESERKPYTWWLRWLIVAIVLTAVLTAIVAVLISGAG